MVGAISSTIGATNIIGRQPAVTQQGGVQQVNTPDPARPGQRQGVDPARQVDALSPTQRTQPGERANNSPAQPDQGRNRSAEQSRDQSSQSSRSSSPSSQATAASSAQSANAGNTTTGAQQLTPEEQEQVRELQQRDQEVRAHEQAHAAVGGPYAGSPQYETVRGPDGQQYAVSGEVQIDASPENDPEDTIRKMEVVIRAALAPAQPSPQDRQIAQQARQQLIQAQAELSQQETENRGQNENSGQTQEAAQQPGRQNRTPFEQALARFQQAENTERLGRERPINSGNETGGGDTVEVSREAQEVISALQTVA